MGAVKNEQRSPGLSQKRVTNGGVSAGAPNGARVAKSDPPASPEPSFLPETARIDGLPTGEFHNKQDGNQACENGPQGKSAPVAESAERAVVELPPEAPIKLRGRPTVLTPERLEQLCQLLALGFSRSQAAAYLGVDRSAVTRAAQRDPELKAELQRAEEVSDLQPQLTVIAEARKNWRAAAWLLQFKAKHRPTKPTEADKDEQHQERLAQIRRDNEALDVLCQKKP
jgi:hypothetical protein